MNFPIALAKFTKYCCVFTKSLVRSEAVMLSYLKYPFYDLPFTKLPGRFVSACPHQKKI